MIRQMGRSLLLIVVMLVVWQSQARADDLLMVRSAQAFSETMLLLQEAIGKEGYTLSRVQRVDIGLTNFGYKTDKYRVVFFAKPEEVRRLSARYPQLVPYLPLKIAIFAEGQETIMVAADPRLLSDLYPDEELQPYFREWSRAMHVLFDKVRRGE